jgi:hypothetical protein
MMVAAGLSFALAGCGASSAHPSVTPGSFASESAAQILATSARAADSAKSVELRGALRASNTNRTIFTLAVVYPSRLSVTIVRGQFREQVISVPAETEVRANLAFWESKTPEATARRYANRWLALPGSAGGALTKQFQALLKVFTARNVACTLARFPHPTLVGTTTVAGQASIELHSNGPSGHDSENLYIATAAPHLPLRQDTTRHAAEASPRSCPGTRDATAGSGYVIYSDWNAVTITPAAYATIP